MTPIPAEDFHDIASLTEDIRRHILSNLGNELYPPDTFRYFSGLAYAIRDRLIKLWLHTQASYYDTLSKRVYYLSMGRALTTLFRVSATKGAGRRLVAA